MDDYCFRTIDGVEVVVFNYAPKETEWAKFVAFARKKASPKVKHGLSRVLVFANENAHGYTFSIFYAALNEAGYYVITGSELDNVDSRQ